MRALAILLVPCAVACTPDFAAPSDVTDLRVLAVQAEPPEAQFDGGVEPVQVNVNILAVDPRNQAPIEVRAQLCAPTDSRRCDQGQPISDVSDAGLSTALALSSPFLVSAAQRDDLNGFGGIRVQYSFSIENGDPEGPVYGSKLLLFSPAGGTPNRNPAVIGLRLTRDGIPYGGSDPSPGDTIELPSEIELGLLPLIPTDICEEYVTTDFRGNQVFLTEQPRYSFFVTPGAEIGVDTADEPLDGVPPPDGLSRVTAHSGEGTLWIVVRDGRGGESWARFQWKATPEAKPTSSRPALDRCPPARQ